MTATPREFAHPIDAIIAQVDSESNLPGLVHVHLNAKTGEVIPRPGRAGGLLGLRRTLIFRVVTDTPVDIYDQGQTLRIFSTTEKVEVGYRLSVIARSRPAADIVRALAAPMQTPGDRLREIVERALADEVRERAIKGPEGLLAEIGAEPEEWQRKVAERIARASALEVKIYFNSPDHGEIRDERRVDIRQEMRTLDAPNWSALVRLQVVLDPSGSATERPLPRDRREREQRLRACLGSNFPADISLYDVWYDKPKVQVALQQTLTDALQLSGFRVREVLMDPVEPLHERTEQVNCDLVWNGRGGRQIRFRVEATLTLMREGTGLYHALKLGSRADWLRKEAEQALAIAMHARDFEDMNVAEQAAVSQHLENQLHQRARETGQKIMPFLVQPLIPENIWLSTVPVDLGEHDFRTRDPLVSGRLGVSVDIRFATLRRVIDEVRLSAPAGQAIRNYSDCIRELIGTLTLNAIDQAMNQVNPGDYFLSWEAPAFEEGGGAVVRPSDGGPMIGARLAAAAETALTARLKPETVRVTFRKVDSGVGHFHRLAVALDPISVAAEVVPHGLGSLAQLVPVNVRLRVEGLEPGEYSQIVRNGSARLAQPEVERSVKDATEEFLLDYQPETLQRLALGRSGDDGVYSALEAYLAQRLREIYGLRVTLETARVGHSQAQTAALKRNGVAELATGRAAGQLEMLQELEIQVFNDEVGTLRAQLAQLGARLARQFGAATVDDANVEADRRAYDAVKRQLEAAITRQLSEGQRVIQAGSAPRAVLGAAEDDDVIVTPPQAGTASDAVDEGN
ncbi:MULTISPECIES: hypothetical protein [unclassified Xanthobacter]|uniref:hypothetical protein n=1 Tax=unclassified Xanthobacter TaxID=2623496 RepID=UPI001EDE7A65|nr:MULTISPECIES: hypothetical protein [unclassified Xanthobacter]